MSEQLRESLSALKDGEAQELELRRLLISDEVDDLNGHWKTLHQFSDVMKGEYSQFHQWDISAKVAEAIIDEPSFSGVESLPEAGEASKVSPSWLKPFAGFAVAASVTLAVVLGAQLLNPAQTGLIPGNSSMGGATVAASRVYPASISNVSLGGVAVGAQLGEGSPLPVPGLSRQVLKGDMAAEQQLDKYLLLHTEQAAFNNGQGMINFARVSGFEVK